MSRHLHPGPPLIPDEEHCACAPPTTREYLQAGSAAVLVALGSTGAWLALCLFSGKLYGTPLVAFGLLQGWVMYHAAGRHRSPLLGGLAIVATAQVAVLGYALLWSPLFNHTGIYHQISWEHLVMVALGGFLAWMMTGAKRSPQ